MIARFSLFVAGLQAGLAEAAIRAEILPGPADQSVAADRLHERLALPK